MSYPSSTAERILSAPTGISKSESKSLRAQLKHAQRMNQLRSYALILPLLVFLLVSFVVPIANLLVKSVHDPVVSESWPRTASVLRNWDASKSELPGNEAFVALTEDLVADAEGDASRKVATRLNFEASGMRGLVVKTARSAHAQAEGEPSAPKDKLLAIDPRWGERKTWLLVKQTSAPWTLNFYLKAVDLTENGDGEIVSQPEDQRLYLDVFGRTAWVSLSVSLLCLLIGYPVACLLASLPPRYSNLMLILVLLPFWTSILVRTTAWIVVLQSNGVLNALLIALGITKEGFTLVYNRFGVMVAMTHILLPYAILSLYAVMKGVPNIYVKAARSLGAGPVRAFFSVYFPQTLPGVAAAGVLTFILAVGYYITPASVGGPDDQLASYYIANHVNTSLNWGLAAALASLLLVGVTILYGVFVRLTGGAGVKLG